jgi:hypothetical protein
MGHLRFRIRRVVAGVGLLGALFVLGSPARNVIAQETQPRASTPAAATAEPGGLPLEVVVAPPQDEKVDTERRRKLRLAILTGGLIGVTGMALVVFTILGGSATRRGLRRKPLKDQPPALEPIPSERFDEREASRDDGDLAEDSDDPRPDGGAR